MDVRARRGSFDLFFIRYQFLFGRQLELHVLRLRRAAISAGFAPTLVAGITVRTSPFVLNVSYGSSGRHGVMLLFGVRNYTRSAVFRVM
jgi:hypothetical protein